ncbi:MAG: TIM-barrel domain-containing protein [Kiritimatiellia bacterium]
MKRAILFLALPILAADARPVWKSAEPGKGSLVVATADATELRIDVLADNLFRVRKSWTNDHGRTIWTESGLNRYGILKADWPEVAFRRTGTGVQTASAAVEVEPAAGTLTLRSLVSPAHVRIRPQTVGKGFAISFSLEKDERIYGFGDSGRDNIMRRGHRFDLWIRNNLCNIPIPMAVSRKGWGLLLNSTWRNAFDCGAKDPDALLCEANEGDVDFYVFTGRDYRELLDVYTRLSGRPALLPVWGYGFTFVCNQNIDQFGLVNEALQFRDRDLPCDVIGLEPGWMQTFYDKSVNKEWHAGRFDFPYWAPRGGHTFISALRRLGFKLSLWLCCDYDLTRYEEQCVAGLARKGGRMVDVPAGIAECWEDDRIGGGDAAKKAADGKRKVHKGAMYDRLYCPENDYPEGALPWFEHLKKFVDQGVLCFKLDGCNQFGEHPNRAWANGMSDEEMHNLYAAVYDKQMARGFEAYTHRRSMVYSAGGYAGVQQFVATWAGDTGGGAKPLASLLNLGISGHSNQSCDMTISDVASLHFGFLQTWSQQNNWDYWHQPWLYPPEQVAVFRDYARLRYRLLPYLYTAAAEAARTGWPVMRALPLVYPDVPAYDACVTTYMLGPDLLVGAFTKEISVPEGVWYDWKTGEEVKGPCRRPVRTTAEWGGALYVRAGAVIPMWPCRSHVERGWNEELEFHVWPGRGTAALYEDDGVSLDYRQGAGSLFRLETDGVRLTIRKREGSFAGMPSVRAAKVFRHRANRPDAEAKPFAFSPAADTVVEL